MDVSTTLDMPNGMKMPIFGLGTWLASKDDVKGAIECAVNGGCRLIDAARLYLNEDAIGETLQKLFAAGTLRREDIFITSKLWTSYMYTAELIERAVNLALTELQVDYIDLYLIHFPVPVKYVDDIDLFPKPGNVEIIDIDHVELWQILERYVDEGKIKSLGVSNFNIKQMERILAVARHPICCNQVELNVYIQQEPLVEFCKKHKITVTAFAPLGTPNSGLIQEGDGNPRLLQDPKLKEIGDKYNKTPAQVALRYLIEKDIAVVPKSVNPSHIKENSEIFDFELSPADRDEIKKLDKHLRLFKIEILQEHPEWPYGDSGVSGKK